jgi:hypothetical protein
MAQILSGNHILSGVGSQRLRSFCYSNTYTGADLDDYARLLQKGPIAAVISDFEKRCEAIGIEGARRALAEISYGPTKIPIFNYILQLTVLDPENRPRYIAYVRYLALEAKVPVDSADLSGTTALMYSISTKPYLDMEMADILLEAGGNINHRNRYGCVAAHDIVMAKSYSPEGKKKTLDALKYFVEHGGDVNIADGDGLTAKYVGLKVARLIPEMAPLLGGGDGNAASDSQPSTPTLTKKVGRNDPCICGSKKKYKVCCGKA